MSPLKRSGTTPNLQTRSRQLFDEEDIEIGDEDEDEETLQLKLAAIEAKLKLKKIQQNKSQSQMVGENESTRRTASALRRPNLPRSTSGAESSYSTQSKVEVPLSPTKRPISAFEPRSPSRVLLGIDKGWKGSDVSLGRSSSVRTGSSRPTSRISQYDTTRSARSATPSRSIGLMQTKTFSERMAEGRSQGAAREARKEEMLRKRSSSFRLDHAELESFRSAAEEAKNHEKGGSPTRKPEAVDYGREAVLSAYHDNKAIGLRRSNTVPSQSSHTKPPGPNGDGDTPLAGGDPSLYDPFSQLHLSNRILPHSFLQRTFESAEPLRIPWLLRNVTSPDYELPSTVTTDIVLFGIVASKSSPKNHKSNAFESNVRSSNDWEKKWDDGSQNEKKFMVMTLTDLTWTIDLYLFSTALPRYHRLNPGTLVAILNPGIMPPKRGREDTGQFSLTLSSDADQVLEIGTARDLGFCKTVKKDGQQCGEWLDSRKTEFCDFHVDLQVRKTQAGRMGVNSSESSILSRNRFGGGGEGSGVPTAKKKDKKDKNEEDDLEDRPFRNKDVYNRDGSRYNAWSATKYYVIPSGAPGANKSKKQNNYSYSTNKNEDPFLPEGILDRDSVAKPDRLRKRLATEAKEREIAKTLGKNDLGRARTSAGGEYLRKRSVASGEGAQQRSSSAASSTAPQSLSHQILFSSSQSSAAGPTPAPASSPSELLNTNGKRSADSVRLSPIKKKAPALIMRDEGKMKPPPSSTKPRKVTRFITEKGIREAGRESLGGPSHDVDEDDDLDIV